MKAEETRWVESDTPCDWCPPTRAPGRKLVEGQHWHSCSWEAGEPVKGIVICQTAPTLQGIPYATWSEDLQGWEVIVPIEGGHK